MTAQTMEILIPSALLTSSTSLLIFCHVAPSCGMPSRVLPAHLSPAGALLSTLGVLPDLLISLSSKHCRGMLWKGPGVGIGSPGFEHDTFMDAVALGKSLSFSELQSLFLQNEGTWLMTSVIRSFFPDSNSLHFGLI